jgi:hypothetical protein
MKRYDGKLIALSLPLAKYVTKCICGENRNVCMKNSLIAEEL